MRRGPNDDPASRDERHHEQTDAIENEKDPAALKAKIAEHRALMEQMRGQMMQQGGMMQMMMGGMGGTSNATGDSAKPSTK